MQHRMREFQMTEPAVQSLLDRCPVMILSTTGADGFPYGVPVHTLWLDGKLYFHGLPHRSGLPGDPLGGGLQPLRCRCRL